MPRKNNDKNPLQIRLQTDSLPKSVTPKQYYRRLLEHIVKGTPLPSKWEVNLSWRNPNTLLGRTKDWQTDDFESAIADSRSGFVSIVHRELLKRYRRLV